MSKNPISEAMADAIRSQSMWTTTTTKKEVASIKIVIDLSNERPIHLICGSVALELSEKAAKDVIEGLRQAVRLVRASNDPETPDLKLVK